MHSTRRLDTGESFQVAAPHLSGRRHTEARSASEAASGRNTHFALDSQGNRISITEAATAHERNHPTQRNRLSTRCK